LGQDGILELPPVQELDECAGNEEEWLEWVPGDWVCVVDSHYELYEEWGRMKSVSLNSADGPTVTVEFDYTDGKKKAYYFPVTSISRKSSSQFKKKVQAPRETKVIQGRFPLDRTTTTTNTPVVTPLTVRPNLQERLVASLSAGPVAQSNWGWDDDYYGAWGY
jgi:hypothetical protein